MKICIYTACSACSTHTSRPNQSYFYFTCRTYALSRCFQRPHTPGHSNLLDALISRLYSLLYYYTTQHTGFVPFQDVFDGLNAPICRLHYLLHYFTTTLLYYFTYRMCTLLLYLQDVCWFKTPSTVAHIRACSICSTHPLLGSRFSKFKLLVGGTESLFAQPFSTPTSSSGTCNVCMDLYVHAYTYVYLCVYIYMFVFLYMHIYMYYSHTQVCYLRCFSVRLPHLLVCVMYACMYLYVHAYMYVYLCVYIYMCVCMYIYLYVWLTYSDLLFALLSSTPTSSSGTCNACMYVRICMYIYTCISICMNTQIHLSICVCIPICISRRIIHILRYVVFTSFSHACLTPVAGSVFGPLSQTHFSKSEFRTAIFPDFASFFK